MAKDLKVQLELTAKDNASQIINKVGKDTEKAFKDSERAAQTSSQAQVSAAGNVAKATESSNKRIEQSYRNARKTAADVARARETLGVRSENMIQREIEQTRAAYDRLKRSGVASQNELRRAAEQTKQRIKELNGELGKTSFGDKMASVGRGVMSVGAGLAAGTMVTAPKMMAAADYDMALARVADTGYSGGTIEEKTQGKEKIHQAIKSSVTQYGGTKEDALAAINELMAQGQVSVDSALSMLPIIQKNATATGAATAELTNMINSMLRFGVKEEELQIAFDYMNASGKAGGFELKDMAQYFPQILANAGANGLNGLEDLKKVGVNLQQVYGVSGGASETATNLNNYYSKVKASSTADNIEDLEFIDKNGKKKSIDMSKSMQHYMKQGQNASEALLSIIGDVLKNDTEYQKLLKEYQTAQESDKKAIMQKVSKYVEGTKVAEIMPDLQAGLATYAMLNDKKTAENVQAQYQIADKGNYNQESFDWISKQSAFGYQVAKNNHEMAQLENFQKANDMAVEVAKGYSSLAQEFPNLHSALIGAKDAVIAFSTALMASSVMSSLGGGKGLSGIFSRTAKTVPTVASTVAGTAATTTAANTARGAISATATAGRGTLLGGFAGLAAGLAFQGAAEGAIPYHARTEAEREKREEQTKQYHQANGVKPQSGFAYAPTTKGIEPKYNYHGGYVMANRMQANQVTQERAKQGSLNEAEAKARLDRNQTIIDNVITPKVEATANVLATYQADFQAFGESISTGLEAGLAAQSHTIANQITVQVDGRTVAESVSEQQFNFNKRTG